MEIFVDEFALTPKRFIAGTKGSYGFCTMHFRFGPEWDGLAKKVTFYPLDGSDPVYLLVTGDRVEIPQEIMRCAGVNRYVVSGCKNEDVLISITGEIDVLDALSPDGNLAEEPTPSQMEQVMTMMQRAVEVAQSVRDDADRGVFKGEKGDTGEKGDSGARGEKGEKGDKGDKGDTGEVSFAYAHKNLSNALKKSVSGEAIAITDVSPLEHEMDVKVRSKNLFKPSTSKEIKGITFELLEDGTFHVYGTNDGTGDSWHDESITLPKGKYAGSGCPEGGSSTTWSIEYHNRSTGKGKTDYGDGVVFETAETNTIVVHMVVRNGQTIDAIFKPMVEEGTTATDYVPYIEDISSVEVKKYGKNLFKATGEKVYKGITAELREDGSYHVFGTSDGTGDFFLDTDIILPKGKYTGSGCPSGGSSASHYIEFVRRGAGKSGTDYGNGTEIEAAESQMFVVHMVVKSGQTVDLVFKPMIEVGTGDKVYEPFKTPTLYMPDSYGEIMVSSICPTTTLISNTEGAVIDCTYNRDLNKAFEELYNAIISTGGNV